MMILTEQQRELKQQMGLLVESRTVQGKQYRLEDHKWILQHHIWLVASTPRKNISQWEGLYIPYIMENDWNRQPDIILGI
jgi:uncharacterized protein YifN (PemK superfamily)